ncbi:MAG: HEAT repeat domain-containing protein [Pirellulales bacterium]|nr:HEAT repeat domain-containing protein [Pirellulales bacterium]
MSSLLPTSRRSVPPRTSLVPLLAVMALSVCAAPPARGEIFQLANKGRIEGKLLNPDEQPREKYVIETKSGGRVTLARTAVVDVIHQTAAQTRYEEIRPQYPDTVAGQWELAEWCRQNGNPAARKTHLERILELDTNHLAARRALGYTQLEGKWVTQDSVMASRGYVKYKGRWVLPQEVQLIEERRQTDQAEAAWRGKLKRWRDWLETDRAEEAIIQLRALRDPDALPALTRALKEDEIDAHRALYAQAVSNIATPKALALLVQLSLEDPNEEVRLTALDYLAVEKHPDVVAQYISGLRSKDNQSVNRAADCLRVMNSPTAVEPLIDALVTVHKHKITSGSPESINSTFNTTPGGGGAPGGLSVGQSTRIITQRLQNHSVLDALIKLTGANFDFDVPRWKQWFATRKAPADLDARRN